MTTSKGGRDVRLPALHTELANLTCLELKRHDLLPTSLLQTIEHLRGTLEELYLTDIHLKTVHKEGQNGSSKMHLWVGVPNRRPGPMDEWLAMAIRCATPRLRICRASFLAYDTFPAVTPFNFRHREVDLDDPCELSRSLSQRFVEVVTGLSQPLTVSGLPVAYLPKDPKHDGLLAQLRERKSAPDPVDYDAVAYQSQVANPTSRWRARFDPPFMNGTSSALNELQDMVNYIL